MNDGWVKLYRKLGEHPRSNDPDWVAVWVRLLLLATHRPMKMVFGKEIMMLEPGQLITSRESLQRLTGVNQHKIDRLLNCFKNEQQIEQRTCSVSRLITIRNWKEYQCVEQPPERQMSSECAASEQRVSTNKNIKNIRTKEVQENPLPLFPAEPVAELVFAQHLRTEKFMKVWTDWVSFRKTLKKCKDWIRLFQYQLEWLKDFPEETASAILSQSIMNGWQGLKPLNQIKIATNPNNGRMSLYDMRSIMQAKEVKAAALKRKHCSEVATGETWSNPSAQAEYRKLKKEITELNNRISECH